jgi:hypothetical protein
VGLTPSLTLPRLPVVRLTPEAGSAEITDAIQEINTYLTALQRYLDNLSDAVLSSINDRHMVGTLANRPAAAEEGRTYLSTDEAQERLYVDDGSAWHQFNSV